jgi:hypothetical protein
MESEGSLPYSEAANTGHYSELDKLITSLLYPLFLISSKPRSPNLFVPLKFF